MKGESILAIAVCLACFLLGYLAYVCTTYFTELLFQNSAQCERSVEGCSQQEQPPRSR